MERKICSTGFTTITIILNAIPALRCMCMAVVAPQQTTQPHRVNWRYQPALLLHRLMGHPLPPGVALNGGVTNTRAPPPPPGPRFHVGKKIKFTEGKVHLV